MNTRPLEFSVVPMKFATDSGKIKREIVEVPSHDVAGSKSLYSDFFKPINRAGTTERSKE